MIKKSFNTWLPTLLICGYSFSDLFGIVTIKANHPYFQYTGRIDFSVPEKPVLYWLGTYIKASFEGSVLVILLDDKTGQSFYNVFIDEDFDHPRIIDCRAGSNIYPISATLSDTIHSLLIFRRTEASTGPTKFLGIQLNDGKTLLPPRPRPEHKLLFYGNSITCGMGNEAPDNSGDDDLAHENNFLAYGAMASRLLNAEYMCIAKSGIGIMISWFDMVMSQYYYRLDPDNPDSHWDFSQYIPDVVVINLFQNDSWLIHKLNPEPDSTQIINAYVNFVREIRGHHPNAFIICALGSMDATKPGSPWPRYIEQAVAILRTQDHDTNIDTFFFPFDPHWVKHPRVRHHQVMGKNLADFIQAKMGWSTDVNCSLPLKKPKDFNLLKIYPNPFNSCVAFHYSLHRPQQVNISIFDILGRKITELVNAFQNPGNYQIYWNGQIDSEQTIGSGIYFCKLEGEDFFSIRKMILLK
ncbi:MAG: T9SS type A sorting domain-containing protein [candidate division KSB1 bacterium]|nr:T9SS type A sorting domain-containing protein [candidate division KSB1 bacterium]MDZ7358696.1 T9SS type A sorting domain-containing protein [candidate division KSB1 bacterium]